MSRLTPILLGFTQQTSQPRGGSRISSILQNLGGTAYNMAADAGDAISDTVSNTIKNIKGALPQIAGSTGFGYKNNQKTFYSNAHHGIDTIAPAGSPIVTSIPFQVTTVKVGNEGGLQVYGTDPNGNKVRFLHMGKAGVKVGDRVQAGQSIGTVGRVKEHSANEISTGSHNHFDIQTPDGKYLDPETYSVGDSIAYQGTDQPNTGSRISKILSNYRGV